MKQIYIVVFLSIFLSLLSSNIHAQDPCATCASVTTIDVDLSANPDSVWISPVMGRDNNKCCQGTGSDRCIRFNVKTHPKTGQLSFTLATPPIPPGQYYSIDCGPAISVGTPLCVDGGGTYCIVYCKPGNDLLSYQITSTKQAEASPNFYVGEGCRDTLWVEGLVESTIQWRTVFPSSAYDSYLSCLSGCSISYVQAQVGYPPYIDVEVSGDLDNPCQFNTFTDTVRVSFVSDKAAEILPPNPNICFGGVGVELTAVGTGGYPPYEYKWSTGETTEKIFVTAPGSFAVTITDSTDCPPVAAATVVTAHDSKITADAGTAQVCVTDPSVQLNGVVQVATGGEWSGGGGAYNPDNTSLNAIYTLSGAEVTAEAASLTLTTTGNAGCPPESDIVVFDVVSAPTVYAGEDAMVCDNITEYQLNGTVGGSAFSGKWTSLGTGTFEDATNTVTKYYPSSADTAAGSVTLVLSTVKNTLCKVESDSIVLTFRESPLVNFSFPQPVCTGENVAFSDQTTVDWGVADTYFWDFDNSVSSTQQNPTIAYTAPGNYDVSFTVTSDKGCSNTKTKTLIVSTDPVADFTFVNKCYGEGVNFSDNSTNAISWQWDFSGDAVSGDQNPTGIVFNAVGNHTVTLTVENSSGCTNTNSKTITVHPLPVASFDMTQPACIGEVVQFTDLSVVSTGIIADYDWDFGNGATSIQQNPVTTYPTSGTFTTSLTIRTDKGCEDNLSKSVVISPNPVADFTFSSSCFGDQVDFTDLSSDAISWDWDFSDGDAVSTDQNPANIVFNSVGSHNVALEVVSSNGCVASVTKSIEIYPLPIVDFLFTKPSCTGQTVEFSDQSIIGSGIITDYAWNFGNTLTSTLKDPTTSYGSQGAYNVRLTAKTNRGCSATTSKLVNVSPDPVADFSFSNGCFGTGVDFTDASTGAASWSWNFSDGDITTSSQNPSGIVLNSVGLHDVALTVTSADGCQNTNTKQIEIYPLPSTNFSFTQPACTDQTISFTDLSNISSGTNDSYSWDFGNSQTSSLKNPTNSYSASGTYNVALKVTSDKNCSSSATKQLIVSPDPIADFSSTTACFGEGMDFTDASTGAVSWVWDFDGQSSSTLKNPSDIVFNTIGTHSVSLTVESINGCANTKTKNVVVDPLPTADFSFSQPACSGENINFTDLSSVSTGTLDIYAWDFDNGSSSAQTNPVSSYATDGSYVVSLDVTTDKGCTTNMKKIVVVSPDPVADFTYSNACQNQGITFTDGSTDAVSWKWDFGGSASSTAQNPAGITFSTTGLQTVTLTVESADGCIDLKTQDVDVHPVPVPNFNYTKPSCTGQTIQFEDLTTISSGSINSYSWSLGNSISSNQQNPSTTYTTAGTYTVKLTATSNQGCSVSNTQSVNVTDGPTVDFTFTNACFEDGMDFTDLSTNAVTWDWNFSDGDASSTAQNPAGIFFNTVGSHTVKLTAETANGCVSSKTKTVEVYPHPVPNFSYTQPACTGEVISFTDNSTITAGSINNYSWDFGNSKTSVLKNPNTTYSTTGTYSVSMLASSDHGCTATVSKNLEVSPDPVASFSFANGCFGEGVDFTDASTDAVKWNWDFSGGDEVSTEQNPSDIVFNAVGSHSIVLTVESTQGCVNTKTRNINIYPVPVADFSFSQPACSGQNINFTNSSSITSGSIDSYSWDFANSQTSIQQNPVTVYVSAGTYPVSMTATSDNGCAVTKTRNVIVSQEPTADFSFNHGCFGEGIDFSDASTGAVSWSWNFDNEVSSNNQNPMAIVFSTVGTHDVSLTVQSTNGCSNSITKTAQVYPQPAPFFSFAQPVCTGQTVNFTDQSTVSTGTITNFSWDFANSLSSTLQHPSTTYTTSGSYNVSLTTTTDKGCSKSKTIALTVSEDPLANFSFANGCFGDGVDFTDLSTDAVSWDWDFSNGDQTSNLKSPANIVFNAVGSHDVKLTVENSDGCSATQIKSIEIYPKPLADFSFTQPACTGEIVSFTDKSTVSIGSVSSFAWDFDNSLISTLKNPSTVYAATGSYTVAFTATSSDGCSTSITKDVSVSPEPVADFSFANGCFGQGVTFNDLSSNASSWSWDFSNGDASSTDQDPAGIVFNNVGLHNVTLTVESPAGCVSSKTQSIEIYPIPTIDFQFTQPACTGETVNFTNSSTVSSGTINAYAWDFANSQSSTQANPSSSYVSPGNYDVSLKATTDKGCVNTAIKSLEVSKDPVANFSFSNGCFSEGIDFSDASTEAVSWDWDFSDGDASSADQNPSGIVFNAVGTHDVKLTVQSSKGCVSSATKTIEIYPKPIADFSFSQPACIDQNINFTNLSSVSSGTIDGYAWDFANTKTSVQQNPVSVYGTANTYPVSMTVTTDQGCSATKVRNVIVSTKPTASFSFTNGCFNDGMDFSDLSTDAVKWNWNFSNDAFSTNQHPQDIVFNAVGNHDVTLIVENSNGCSSTLTQTIEVYPLPSTFFSFTQPACTGQTINFTDASSISKGSIATYNWDFANSSTSTLQNPTSSYSVPGDYDVNLTATSDKGCIQTKTLTLTVSEDPVANFSFANGCFGDGINFTDLSTDAATWNWDFSNGDETSKLQNPINIVFNAIGSHDVTLTVENGDGCSASLTKSVVIFPLPEPDFTFTQPVCRGETVSFTDASTISSGTLASFSWDFANTKTATLQNPSTIYTATGIFGVKLTATSGEGCSATVSKNVTVAEDPVVDFSFNNGCFGSGVDFTDLSSNAASWDWDFSNGDETSTDQNPSSIQFNNVGLHDVRLTVESPAGCISTNTKSIEIYPVANVDFIFTQPACTGENVSFTNSSTVSAGTINSYVWDFANSQTSTQTDPTTSYVSPGTYDVKLQATTDKGCASSAIKSLDVSKDPLADFSFANGCFSEGVNFTDASTEAVAWDWDFSNGDETSTDQNPAGIIFNAVGLHDITLTVKSSKGCISSVTKSIDIYPKPVPDFSFSQPACIDQNINFTNSSTVSSGTIDGYAWDFANTKTSAQQNPVTVYGTANTYPVSLTVTTDRGCSATKLRNVIVSTKPTANFSFTNGCFNDGMDFTDISTDAVKWDWNFSNDAFSTNQHPQDIVFNAVGNHDVTLIVENTNGCSSTLTQTIEVYPLPSTFFSFTQPACIGQTVNFTDASSISKGSIASYTWDFANSSTSALQNPTSSYSVAGDYDVNLTTTSDKGCSQAKTQTLTVSSDPIPSFSFVNACFGDGINFTDASTDAVSWDWDFSLGDETSSLQNPTNIVFNAVGSHDVTLTVENGDGCSASLTKSVEIYPLPQPDFSFTQPACIGQTVNFNDASTVSAGTIDSYSWDFANAKTALIINPTTSYSNAGSFAVELITTTNNGCTASIIKNLTVSKDPVADFTFTNGCFGKGMDFKDLSTDADSWDWDFSNGDETSTDQNPKAIVFNADGQHQVSLKVTSINGCINTKTQTIEVFSTPIPNFNFTQPACSGQDIHFTNTSSINTGSINAYSWAFANGKTSNLANPITVYNSAGTYPVNVTITSDKGCSASLVQDVEVAKDPLADFAFSNECLNDGMGFTDLSINAAAWEWDFSNGDTSSTDQNPSNIVLNAVGLHDVTLTVTSAEGCLNSKTKSVEVYPLPITDFNFSQPACSGENINFTNTSSISKGSITDYYWDFANTKTSIQANPSTVYDVAGIYSVELTTTSDKNCVSTTSKNVTVSEDPIADFSFVNGCFNKGMDFTDLSTGAVTWDWDFSGDDVSTSQNPTGIVFNSVGTHNVTLSVQNSDGCSSSTTKEIEVYPLPVPFFTFSQPACSGKPVSFTDGSTVSKGSITNFDWDFDNGKTATIQNPSSTYSTPGSFTVSLTTTTNNNCKQTVSKTVAISPDPVAEFTFDNTCFNAGVNFTDQSTNASQWEWDFNGNSTSTDQNPNNINFPFVGDHDVTLYVENADGCSNSLTKTVTINPNPVADFSFNQPACIGENIAFTNASSVSSGSINAYNWDFANTLTSIQPNPTTSYSADDSYSVKLSVSTNNGCSASISKSVVISPDPVADFSFSNKCFNEAIDFTDLSTDAVSWNWNFSEGDETSSNQNPTGIIFNSAGTHNVSLTVTSGNGCKNTKVQTADVYPRPVPNYSFTQPACTGEEITFTNTTAISSGTISSYSWDFANSLTSLQESPKTSYSLAGTYNVRMTATSDKGCSETAINEVPVSEDPVADFSFVNSCVDNAVSFADLSTNAVSWSWDFAGNAVSIVQHPSGIVFDQVGLHDITLTVESGAGCTNSKKKTIEVYPRPAPDFSFTQPACTDQNVAFSNATTISSGSIASYAWNFGNLITSTQYNPVTTYSVAQEYTVRLTATSSKGCSETISKDIVVNETPTALFSSDKLCFGQGTDFTDLSSGAAKWDWNFSNDAYSSVQNPQDIIFNATGLHTVSLSVTSAEGCINSKSDIITIYPVPEADYNVDNVCVGEDITFYDNSAVTDDVITTWLWDFNGVTSNLKNPTQKFTSDIDINVQLIASTATCSDTLNRVIAPLKTPTFTPDPFEGCSPLRVQFDNEVVESIVYKWDFDDGVTAATPEPDHIFFNKTGATKVFDVKLVASSIYGCNDSTVVPITVFPETEANFTISNNKICSGVNVAFTNTTVNGSSYLWNLGDGSASQTTENLNYAYTNSTPGTDFRQVTLISTTTENCKDTVNKFVTVYPIVENIISLSATEACHPANITLTANSETVNYQWDYGDGTIENGSENMNHTFENTSSSDISYTVNLTTTSAQNCSSSTTADIVIHPSPEALFSVPATVGCSPFDVTISNYTNGAISYSWDYGDGNTSAETATEHTYTYKNAGPDQDKNTLSLLATSIDGCTDSYTLPIFVSPDIIADFTMDSDQGCDPLTVQFTNTTTGGNTYKWTLNSSNTVTQVSPQFTFSNENSTDEIYNVVLDANSKYGCKSSANYPVTVYPSTDADFSVDKNQLCSNNLVTFTNNSRNADISNWNFGDGSAISNETAPAHTYVNSGTTTSLHTVTLNTETSKGCKSSVQKNISVFAIPSSKITADKTEGCHPLKISFSAPTGAQKYVWDFGDGTTETTTDKSSHTFTNTSETDIVYTVSLTATSSNGCTSQSDIEITVHPTPVPQFSISAPMICAPDELTLTNTSTGASQYSWNYGDGQTSSDATAVHSHLYNNSSSIQESHTITLIASNSDGCVDSTSHDVNVSPEINASFTTDADKGCEPLDVSFTNTSTGASTYTWTFDASNNTTEQNPDFTFANDGSLDSVYTVILKSTSIFGCTDTDSMPITVYPSTTASFSIVDNQVCSEESVSFINSSRNADISSWDFGDGSAISNDTDPSHVFTNTGTTTLLKTVTLTTETSHGCNSFVKKAVTVYAIPSSQIALDKSEGCHPAKIQLTASSGAKTYSWDYGDGESEIAPENTSHIFTNTSETDIPYTISLTATSVNGCTSQSTANITVFPTPVPGFDMDDSQVCGETNIAFTNTAIKASSYSWNFGDGSSESTLVNPTHQYFNTSRNDIVNKITQTATSDKGCVDSISKYATIFPLPLSELVPKSGEGCHPFKMEIAAPSGNKTYEWDFGDGTTESGSDNVNHIFSNTSQSDATFTVKLITTSANGCVSESTSDMVVHPTPVPAFSISNKAICAPAELTITNNTVGGSTFSWRYGDGGTGNDATSVHKHLYENKTAIQQNFTIQLTATNNDGCIDSTNLAVAVYPEIVADFETDLYESCTPFELNFSNLSSGAESYEWQFGDGSISSQTNPDHVFKNETLIDETYTVQLKATSKYGCTDSIDTVYTAYPQTTADFAIDNSKTCSGSEIQFTDKSVNARQYQWTFGDGNSSADASPSHTYTNTSNNTSFKTVTLTTTTARGCIDSVQKFVTVFGIPENVIETTPPAACHPASIELIASSGTQTYFWDFGDGNAEAAPQSVTHIFENTSNANVTYTITLTATTLNGCTSETTADIVVYPAPKIDFTIDTDKACAPYELTLTNNTTGAVSFDWTYDDGETGDDASPVHTHLYTNTSSAEFAREIELVATSTDGCISSTKQIFTLSPQIVASFTTDKEIGCPPLPINIENMSTGANTYKWFFGDEGSSTNIKPSHVYSNNTASNITYDLKLNVASKFGCKDSMIVPITVYPATIAEFVSTPTQICSEENVTFENNSTNAVTYQWDFGDNSGFSDEKSPTHQYINRSTATVFEQVQLITSSPDGCTDSSQQFVTVYPIPLNPITLDKFEECHPADINMSANLGLKSYTWDYGDGAVEAGSEEMDHTFNNTSTEKAVYTITLTTVSKENCESSTTTEVTVHPSPSPDFDISSIDGCAPFALDITDKTQNATSYLWNYGDDSTSNQSSSHTHIYQNKTSTITSRVLKLSVSNDFGCTKKMDKTINVYPEIHAEFTNTEPQGCTPVKVEFENMSTGASSYYWDFGDGNISTSHAATSNDYVNKTQEVQTYQTVLIATSPYNCIDTSEIIEVQINPVPSIAFTPKKTAGCSPIDAQFNNTTIGAVSYFWNFGDGATSEEKSPQHTFSNLTSETVTNTITHIATNELGCSDSVIETIKVYPEVQSIFTVTPDEGCSPLKLNIENNSLNAVLFKWDFGDGSIASTSSPDKTFVNNTTEDQFRTIKLLVSSQENCKDSSEIEVAVYPTPSADFTLDKAYLVFPEATVQLNNKTKGEWNYKWNFGDESSSDLKQPGSHTYSEPGEYTISLEAYDECSDNINLQVVIGGGELVADYDSSFVGCAPLTVKFINKSVNADSYLWNFNDGQISKEKDPVHTFSEPGTYPIELTAFNDETYKTVSKHLVTVYPVPEVDFSVAPSVTFLPEATVSFYDLSEFGHEYIWNFGDGNTSTEHQPTYTYEVPGAYDITFIVESEQGCRDTVARLSAVEVRQNCAMRFPNAFTPVNEQLAIPGEYDPTVPETTNNIFHPVHENIEQYTLQIFNRWGELLFESNDKNIGWDGFYKGKLSKQDVYIWQAKGECWGGKTIKASGNVTLIR